jgi:hypothetical protein
MSSQSEMRVFITHSGKAVHGLNGETARRLREMIEANSGIAVKSEFPEYRGGVFNQLSAKSREAVETHIQASAQTLKARFPHLVEGTLNFELRETILDRFSGVGTSPLRFERVGQGMQRDLLGALDEATQVAPDDSVAERPKSKIRRSRRASTAEQIAARVIKRHRQAALSLLKLKRFTLELKELKAVDAGLRKGTKRSCKHASFNARNLMEGLADRLYPASTRVRRSRSKEEHSLGSNDHKNRLIAYVEERLEGKIESHDFKVFVSAMDTVFRWTGSGPHGVYNREGAEHVYLRLLEALAVIARAYRTA